MNLTPNWQTERSRINHDWLKNKFINHLNSLAKLPDDRKAREEVAGNMMQWDEQISKLRNLLDTVEHDMSPARLFEQPPLCRLADQHKQWMVPLLHRHWSEKNDIPGVKSELNTGLEEVRCAFARFKQKFESGDFTAADVGDFAAVCQRFSEDLSSLRNLSVLP